MQTRHYWIAALLGLCLAAQPFDTASAHGEIDAEHVDEFHLHLDDYEEEVEELIAEIRAVADARGRGDEAASALDGLIDHWEDVGVHAAIEMKASVTYPDIWQALAAFRQAVAEARGRQAVTAAADDLQAALWQGYGALRLAASRIASERAAPAE